MANAHGSFIWYELLTRDAAAAKAFYDAVVGWDIDAAAPPGGMDYRMIKAADGNAGGMMQLSDDMLAGGAQPRWLGYIGVDDVDQSVTAVLGAGGQVHMPAMDIPDVGRFAMVTDPQGNPFYLMRGASPESSTAFQRMGMGHVSWNELQTADEAAGLAFYEKLFGITKIGAMPMGELGDYHFIANGDSAGEAIGAIMRQSSVPGWSFYFRVPDIEAARTRIESGGGTVHAGPMDVPGGERVIVASDPEGVAFGLVAPASQG
jgi:uncharacterized protein